MADYLFHLTAQPGSGEFAMNSLLVPIVNSLQATKGRVVFAREPIEPRISELPPRSLNLPTPEGPKAAAGGVGGRGEGGARNAGGDGGGGAAEAVAAVKRALSTSGARPPATKTAATGTTTIPLLVLFGDSDWLRPPKEERARFVALAEAAGKPVDLEVVPGAGHHLYLDNAPHFNRRVNGLHKLAA